MIEINVASLTKAKQRVKVKQTPTRKAHYRTQEVGRKEPEPSKKKSPREGTGKISNLPESMRNEILELRRLGDSGAKIKSAIENMIDSSDDPNIKYDLAGKGIIKDAAGGASLNVTGQSLVDWAKARGVGATVKRKTVKAVEEKAKKVSDEQFKATNEKLARLQTENKDLKERLDKERKSKMDSDAIREKLRNENFILREKLKVLNKPVEESDNKKLVSQYLGGMKHASRHLK